METYIKILECALLAKKENNNNLFEDYMNKCENYALENHLTSEDIIKAFVKVEAYKEDSPLYDIYILLIRNFDITEGIDDYIISILGEYNTDELNDIICDLVENHTFTCKDSINNLINYLEDLKEQCEI